MAATREVNLTAAARLVAKSLAQVSRDAAAGLFGPTRKTKAGIFITVAGLSAHFGKQFTDAEIEAAAAPKRTLSDEDILARIDPGTASFFGERRDLNWFAHLHRLGIGPVQAPPMSEFVTPVLDYQQFFTRRQVEELLAAALAQRDRQWDDWRFSDLVHQAKNSNGPSPLAVKDITIEE